MVSPVSTQSAYTNYQVLETVRETEVSPDPQEESLAPTNVELKGGSHGDFSYAYDKNKGKCCVIL